MKRLLIGFTVVMTALACTACAGMGGGGSGASRSSASSGSSITMYGTIDSGVTVHD